MELAPPWDPFWVAHMVASHQRLLGRAPGGRARAWPSRDGSWIEDVTVLNVLDESEREIRQAASYTRTSPYEPRTPGDVAPLPRQ